MNPEHQHEHDEHEKVPVPLEAKALVAATSWPEDDGNADAQRKTLEADQEEEEEAAGPDAALQEAAARSPNPSGLSSEHRITARDMAVQAMILGYHHAPELHYTQTSKRWQAIDEKRKAWRHEYPNWADCSSYMSWCIWNGLDHFHVRDVVNGQRWLAGWTGTMIAHGVRVDGHYKPQRADLVLYGDPFGSSGHVAGVIGHDERYGGKLMVVSFGSEAGPFYLPFNYRPVTQMRRYI